MKKYKKLFIILAIIISILLSMYGIFKFAFKDFGKYYEEDLIIQSPNGEGFLVIKEWGTFGGTGAEIYYVKGKKDWWFNKTKLGDTCADENIYPFRDGSYTVEWNDNSVDIKNFEGRKGQTSDPNTWAIQIFELP